MEVNLAAYLRQRYSLELELPATVWMEMVTKPAQRQHLFSLMVSTTRAWLAPPETPPAEDLKKITEIFQEAPCKLPDMLTMLAAAGFLNSTLRYIERQFNHGIQAVKYVTRHPGVVPAPRGPILPHRQHTLEKVQIIEKMVLELYKTPILTDYRLAAKFQPKPDSTWRGYATEAKKLAFWRDQLPVKFYERKSSGRKYPK